MVAVHYFYGILPREKIRECRLSGHCAQHPGEEVSKLVMWNPCNGVGNNTISTENLIQDTGLKSIQKLKVRKMESEMWNKNLC